MIGERLKQKISQLGLTQQRAADRLGISQSRLNQYLKDKREPDSQMFCQICETFGVTPNWLYGYDSDSSSESPKINKSALETAILFLKKYEDKHQKKFSAEQEARIVSIVYDIILSESEENAQKAIEWVIEAVA
ncbi:MAG: helix-turn-helix domain-containing protein [Alphaproteobacteria bacterium]|jgi:transcriptional regulator with XRE-family HTH domain